jgi:hypothetical protein
VAGIGAPLTLMLAANVSPATAFDAIKLRDDDACAKNSSKCVTSVDNAMTPA